MSEVLFSSIPGCWWTPGCYSDPRIGIQRHEFKELWSDLVRPIASYGSPSTLKRYAPGLIAAAYTLSNGAR
jgi:hypothetical protein